MNNVKLMVLATLACCLLGLAAPAQAQEQDVASLLGATDVFHGLSPEELSQVAALCALRFGAEGESLIVLGEAPLALYTLVQGHGVVADAAGRILAEVIPGVVVGEYEFVSAGPAIANVVLTQDSEVVEIDPMALAELMETDTDLGYKVMRNMAVKLSTY